MLKHLQYTCLYDFSFHNTVRILNGIMVHFFFFTIVDFHFPKHVFIYPNLFYIISYIIFERYYNIILLYLYYTYIL